MPKVADQAFQSGSKMIILHKCLKINPAGWFWVPKDGLKGVLGVAFGSPIRSWRRLCEPNRARRRRDTPLLRFGDSCGGSKEAKICTDSISEVNETENNEIVDLLHPCLVKSLVLGPKGGQDGAQMGSKSNF